MMAASRIVYGMADSGALPKPLAYVNAARRTPWGAIAVVGVLTMAFFLLGDIQTIANLTNFTIFATFIVINAALIKLRYDQPDVKRSFKVPLNIGKMPVLPIIAIATTLFMMVNVGWDAIIYGTGILVLGIIAYFVLDKFTKKGVEIKDGNISKKVKI